MAEKLGNMQIIHFIMKDLRDESSLAITDDINTGYVNKLSAVAITTST